MSQTDIHAAFGPNHDPSRLDRDRGRRRNRLLRCHHDRHKHDCLDRRQRQLAAPRRLAPGKEILKADHMPACHLRHDRARRKRFRDDPPLVRVTRWSSAICLAAPNFRPMHHNTQPHRAALAYARSRGSSSVCDKTNASMMRATSLAC